MTAYFFMLRANAKRRAITGSRLDRYARTGKPVPYTVSGDFRDQHH